MSELTPGVEVHGRLSPALSGNESGQTTAPDPNGPPVAARRDGDSDRSALWGWALAALGGVGLGVGMLVPSVTACRGATRSARLEREGRRQLVEQAIAQKLSESQVGLEPNEEKP